MRGALTRRPGASRTTGGRRLDPMLAVVIAAGLCGLAVGSALRADPVLPPPPTANTLIGVFATFDVTGMVLDPGPVALLDVAVQNAGSEPVRITDVSVTPPGLPTVTTAVDRVVEPAEMAVVEARADLACGAVPGVNGLVGATVSVLPIAPVRVSDSADPVASAGSGRIEPTTLLALRSGADSELLACQAAERLLPPGADTRRVAGRFAIEGDDPVVTAEGLPVGAIVDDASAGPPPPAARWQWELAAPATVGDDGRVRLVLALPTDVRAICDTSLPQGPSLPAGITITFTDRSGTRDEAYVGIGPDFTRWVRTIYRDDCPGAGS